MLFREYFQQAQLLDRLEHQFQDINWFISANVGELMPLHLIEAKSIEGAKHAKYQIIGGGDTNPKTAKNPDTSQTYLGAVLHLEPYMASGNQTCPFATAIYQIVAGGFDPQTLQLIAKSPGYQSDGEYHTFYGFELRSMQSNQWGKLSDTLLPKDKQEQCPIRMKLRLPGVDLKDWNSGPTIEINRGQIKWTKLVGGCASACLHTAGAMHMASEKLKGRRRKTEELYGDKGGFMAKILLDIFKLCTMAEGQGHKPVIRLNATSDEAWEDSHKFPTDKNETEELLKKHWPSRITSQFKAIIQKITGNLSQKFQDLVTGVAWFISGKTLLEVFQNVQFYDYTKNPSRMKRFLRAKNSRSSDWPNNYHLTFSLAEGNRDVALSFLREGATVAAVFNVMKSAKAEGPLPATWHGFPVSDADKHDYRFLDAPGQIAGLRAKGEAKFASTDFGFVIQPDDPGLDPNDPAVIQAKNYVANFEKRVKSGKLAGQPGDRRNTMKDAGKRLSLPVYY